MSKKFEPTEREILVHKWKCLMCKGDLGAAAVIKKQLEKDKPPKVVEPEVVNTEPVAEEPVKKKRGRPKKK
jgi:hypothetical protein